MYSGLSISSKQASSLSRAQLRVRARISWHFGASAGQADARRRDAGDVVISSRSGNAADACPPPRPAGLRLPRPANHCGLPVMIQLDMGAAAKCQIILARALRLRVSFYRGIRVKDGCDMECGDLSDLSPPSQ